MIDPPTSTKVGRVVPKEKFYSKTSINAKLRQLFTDEIDKIIWAYKIAPHTLNITAKDYEELQVFEITLKKSELSMTILKHIDTFIPYPILFVLKRPGAEKVIMSFKEPTAKSAHHMKVDSYFETSWQQSVGIELKGRSVDEIYKNFLYQIDPKLREAAKTDAKSAVEYSKEREKIQKQVDALNRRIASETSTAKRQEMARERHAIEVQLGETV